MSLVGRAGQLANSIDWIDARILSTDDEDIAREGRTHGARRAFHASSGTFRRPCDVC